MGVGSIHVSARGALHYSLVVVCAGHLLVAPLVIGLPLRLLHGPNTVQRFVTMQNAMPSMAATPIIARKYDKGFSYAALAVFITTLMSFFPVKLVGRLLDSAG